MGRTSWNQLPAQLRDQIEQRLGSPVASTTSQAAGWSPGGADRVLTTAGTRAFVKTLARSQNPYGFGMHETESSVMALLPASAPTPKLIATVTCTAGSDDWIALILDDIDGYHPGAGRDGFDIETVLDALHTLPIADGALAALPRVAPDLTREFAAWDRMFDAGLPDFLPEPVAANALRMAEAAAHGGAAVGGEYLVHGDCRADNLLLDANGYAWIIDWPWAAIGAHWLDPLTYLLDVLVRGEHADVEWHLANHPVFEGASEAAINAVLAGLAGMFLEKAADPRPPGMPGLREFQQCEGIAAAEWLLRRWTD